MQLAENPTYSICSQQRGDAKWKTHALNIGFWEVHESVMSTVEPECFGQLLKLDIWGDIFLPFLAQS